MSQSYNSIKPNVIDDEMLQKAIEEQWPEDIGRLAKSEGVDLKNVTELQLSFRNILQIDNLWQFENLTKLQLDNNIIEKIEALESLVHLVWLDLSFNNIEVIEGLDTLVKLQDLSLYNNRISKIEHMDTLQELQIFSIGKNNLTVVYLRRFKKLRTLNLTGNPFCEEEQYVLFVVAHIPDLVYLDFKRVSDTTVSMSASLSREIGHQIAEHLLCWYDILQLSETLMTLEIQTADQLEVRFKHIPVKPPIQDARGSFFCCSFSLTIFYTMAQCRDLENRHHEKLLEISINTLEKSVKNELDEDLPDDVRELLVDKTTLVNMVNASHSVHLLKIDMRECDILTNAYRWQASVTGKVRGLHEIDRNRNRVKEIFQYIDNLQEQLDNSLQEQLDSIVLVEPPE
uniref:Dynein regulatory complex subunit 3 n=1 Tax=Anas platyrhynchos TaxID=8839 RepID=A0A8B9TD18_ANAPL